VLLLIFNVCVVPSSATMYLPSVPERHPLMLVFPAVLLGADA